MSEKTAQQQCPSPGMDPYLEAPDIWPDFHDALAAAIRAQLNASLPTPYYARLQKRPEHCAISNQRRRLERPAWPSWNIRTPRPRPASRCGSTPARAVDYAGDPEPPLDEADAAWADERLRAAGLRGNEPVA